ncbi:MFS transporter [Streptomyces sp. 4.24]|uniref:MFS transporter n=1 Tax=Streptomyces tritrimontium TaxID=3406573 RepID=UPI003BB4BE4A
MTQQRAHNAPGLRAWLGLAVILGPVLLVSMDGSILFLAMPRISQALSPTADQALWILDIYGFAVGSLLVAFGSIGDRYGRLKLLMIGATVFGLGSAGAAFAPTPELLIACRALMGVAGATLLPSALAVLSELFPDPRRRAQAIGIFAAAFAAGFAIGPIVGGTLLGQFWWGSVFLVNLPVIVAFLVFAPVLLGEVRETGTGRIDLLSVVTSAGGLLLTIYGIKHLAADGVSALAIATMLLGIAVLTFFALRQKHLEQPLIDFSLFRDRVFTIAIITGLLPLAAWSATAFLSGIYLQSVLDLSVLRAALLALPGAAVLTIACIVTPAVVERIGKRAALIVCHFSIAGGLLLLLPTTITGGIGWYVASTALAGVGYGISFSVVADTAVGAVPAERAGSAGAIAETSNEIGNALGIAILGSLAALLFRLQGPDLAPTLDETLQLPALAAAAAQDAKSAFVTALHVVVVVAGLLHAVLGAVALRWLPRSAPDAAGSEAPGSDAPGSDGPGPDGPASGKPGSDTRGQPADDRVTNTA